MIKIIENIDILKKGGKQLRNEEKYSYVGPPSKNGTLVVKKNDKCFHIYINENRKPVRLYKKRYWFKDAGSFSEGFAWVRKKRRFRKKEKEFHITPNGKPAYKERYYYVGSFLNGSTRVIDNKKEFHIGTDGKPLYKERFDKVTVFRDGKAWVKINRSHVFNTNGTFWKDIREEHFYISLDGKKIK